MRTLVDVKLEGKCSLTGRRMTIMKVILWPMLSKRKIFYCYSVVAQGNDEFVRLYQLRSILNYGIIRYLCYKKQHLWLVPPM